MSGFLKDAALAVTWAFIYASPAFFIEGLSNLGIDFAFTHAVDMWPMELGLPGLIAGSIFVTMLGLSGRLRRFEEMTPTRLAALGALAGALTGVIYLAVIWPEPAQAVAVVLAIAIALGMIAGPVSALLFGMHARRRVAANARS